MQPFPTHIQLPPRPQVGGAAAPGLPGVGGPPPGSQGGGDGPDSPQVESLLRRAKQLVLQAEGMEKDAEDQAKLTKLAADIQGFLGAQQKLNDSAMGAGPGVKLIRKTAPGA